jgi:hypothetical protein
MSMGLVFVTAPDADHKLINSLLMHIRDWEYEDVNPTTYGNFKLVTSKNPYDLNMPERRLRSDTRKMRETELPLSSSVQNAWAGAALEEIEAYCLYSARHDALEGKGMYNNNTYVVVDSTGLLSHTCILGERAVVYGDNGVEEFGPLDGFNKMRVPWELVYVIFCNLVVADLSFEDFTQEFYDGYDGDDRSVGKDGWWTYKDVSGGFNLSEDNRGRREREIQRYRDAGHI